MDSPCQQLINSKKSGAGLIVEGLQGVKICYALKFGFDVNNNEAKYEVLIVNLKLARDIGEERLEIFSNTVVLV